MLVNRKLLKKVVFMPVTKIKRAVDEAIQAMTAPMSYEHILKVIKSINNIGHALSNTMTKEYNNYDELEQTALREHLSAPSVKTNSLISKRFISQKETLQKVEQRVTQTLSNVYAHRHSLNQNQKLDTQLDETLQTKQGPKPTY